MLRVVKLGGSTLATPEQVRAMAQALATMHRGQEKVLAVVSAMGKTTDHLYDAFIRAAGERADALDLERFLSQGEWASAQLLAAALKTAGQDSVAITPWDKNWPLAVALQNHAAPLKEKVNEIRNFKLLTSSKRMVHNVIGGHLKAGRIPVVCGFVAKNQSGEVVTLGRGGSDISAFLLADILKADEVILVKDVDGVLPWDPNVAGVHPKAKVAHLEAKELYFLSSAGSRVVHPGALRYLKAGKKARVISYKSDDWAKGGTEILKTPHAALRLLDIPLAALTFIGRDLVSTPGILYEISRPLKETGVSIYSITVSESFLAVYVPEKDCEKAYGFLAEVAARIPQLKSSAVKKGLVKITVSSEESIEAPGAIERLVRPIARAGLNVWEIVTIHSDIMLFVEKPLAQKVVRSLKRSLKTK